MYNIWTVRRKLRNLPDIDNALLLGNVSSLSRVPLSPFDAYSYMGVPTLTRLIYQRTRDNVDMQFVVNIALEVAHRNLKLLLSNFRHTNAPVPSKQFNHLHSFVLL